MLHRQPMMIAASFHLAAFAFALKWRAIQPSFMDGLTFALLILAILTCMNFLGLLYSKTSRDVSARIRWAVEVGLGLIGLCLVWQVWLVQEFMSFYPFLEPLMVLIAACSALKVVGGMAERWVPKFWAIVPTFFELEGSKAG